jgi:hypothetical protein
MNHEWLAYCPICGEFKQDAETGTLYEDCPNGCEVSPEEHKVAFDRQCVDVGFNRWGNQRDER